MVIPRLWIFGVALLVSCGDHDSRSPSPYHPAGASVPSEEIVFGVHPYLSPQELHRTYDPMMRYLERRIPGTRFRVEASKSYADFERKLFEGKFLFALPNPYQTIRALRYNYRVIGKMAPDDPFRGIFVIRVDSGLRHPSDLKGKTISFPAPTALAATMLPMMYLHEHGLDTEKDISPRYVGSQYSSILNAFTGDADAAATWPVPWKAWSEANPDKARQMKVVWQTETLPNNSVVARKDADRDLADRVARFLADMQSDSEGRELLDKAEIGSFELADNETYQPVKDFLAQYDRKIGLPDSDSIVLAEEP